MKRLHTYITIIFLIFAVVGCKSRKKQTNDLSVASAAEGLNLPKDFSFSQSRSSCFGQCPSYTLRINHRGQVSYDGLMFTNLKGKHTKMLSAKEMKKLVRLIEEADLFSYEDSYDDTRVTDLPSVTIEYSRGGKSKKIYNRIGGPKALSDFCVKIDKLIGEKGFEKSSSNSSLLQKGM